MLRKVCLAILLLASATACALIQGEFPTHVPPTPKDTPALDTTPQLTEAHALGDTWVRPSDEMEMVYVPAGEFQMGSTTTEIETMSLKSRLPIATTG